MVWGGTVLVCQRKKKVCYSPISWKVETEKNQHKLKGLAFLERIPKNADLRTWKIFYFGGKDSGLKLSRVVDERRMNYLRNKDISAY